MKMMMRTEKTKKMKMTKRMKARQEREMQKAPVPKT